jgi:hypothetical protein
MAAVKAQMDFIRSKVSSYPIRWMQYFPTDDDLMQWAFGEDIRAGYIKSPPDCPLLRPEGAGSRAAAI